MPAMTTAAARLATAFHVSGWVFSLSILAERDGLTGDADGLLTARPSLGGGQPLAAPGTHPESTVPPLPPYITESVSVMPTLTAWKFDTPKVPARRWRSWRN